ncbi:MAG: GNAT family N-acetyltransferase [Micrococcales bacterium]|nr:GNAT family N-acetyltransferase [Micrococcales bacterium]
MLIEDVAWDDPRAVALRAAQQAEIAARYGTPDSEPGPAPTTADIALFLLASRGGAPLACGALRRLDERHGEIKRMYAVPEARGSGAAVAVLRELERRARELGWERLVLETGTAQPDAMRFYEREGYTAIPLYGYYADSADSLCYERRL